MKGVHRGCRVGVEGVFNPVYYPVSLRLRGPGTVRWGVEGVQRGCRGSVEGVQRACKGGAERV